VQFASVDINGFKKLDDRTVRMTLLYPDVTIFDGCAKYASGIVPVGYTPKAPVGSGPFKFVSFNPLQRVVLDRFDNFWRTDANGKHLPYLDGVTYEAFTDQTAIGNALASSAIDGAAGLAPAQLAVAEANPNMYTLVPQGYGYTTITMRVDQGPFKDVRVRRAMKLMVDREQFVKQVYAGHALIGNDIPAYQDPLYDHTIPQTTQDIEQAKSLLKAAGQSNLSIELITADVGQGVINMAEDFVPQAAAAGINAKLRQVTVTDFYGPNYLKWVFAQDFWYYQGYFAQVNQATLPGSPYNETHWDNPQYIKLYNEALATTDVSKQTQIAHEMQMIDYSEGGYIIPFFPAVIDGYAPAVNGIVESKTGASFNNWDFEHIWKS
jgi:peptide/nickel transport system substrate-binding protein